MNAEQAKIKNIIDMAFGFSAMSRVFKAGEREKIISELGNRAPKIASSNDKQEFQKRHNEFCCWFASNIKTAGRKKNGKLIKKSGPASYGQGAKVLDVALKVFVYYCHLPDPKTAEQTAKWLHAAIDRNMLKYLKKYDKGIPDAEAKVVDKDTYEKLQKLVRKDIAHKFSGSIFPVQWDDIVWRCLNKR